MAIIGIVLALRRRQRFGEVADGQIAEFFYKQQSPQGDLAGVEGS